MIETTLAETTASTIEGVKFYQTGIYIPPGLTFEKWEYLITEMATVEKGFRFWWGDALNYGHHEYGEKYSQAMDATGLSYETIRDYCLVARGVEMSLRNDRLSWTHHKVVAKLNAKEQAEWLRIAETKSLSTSELRAAIAASYQLPETIDNEQPSGVKNYNATAPALPSIYTSGTNGHSAPADTYEQQADELSGDESGYDWTEEDEPVPTQTTEPATALDSNEWYTPVEYIEAARRVMGSIDLDPASNDEAQGFIKAETYHTKETNGLLQEWYGNVWLNPPYADPLPWVAKLLDAFQSGEINEAILLVNTANSPEWSRLLWNSEHTVCLLSKRVRFWRPDRADAKGTAQDQMLWYLGDDASTFKAVFAAYGAIR